MRKGAPRSERLHRWVFAIGLCTGALGLGACAASVPTSDAPSSIPPVPPILATSIETPGGTWATVAMGHLDDPLNTFWQLLFRPPGAAGWSDEVEPTATATNGGLVLAESAGAPLVVAIRPSYDLVFTPIIATADSGRTWTTGLLDGRLVAMPNALAVRPGGHALAITDGHGGDQVRAATSSLSSWQPLVTQKALGSGASGRACGPIGLTAVGYANGIPVVGASCSRPGTAGLFVDHSGGWALAGPPLPSSLAEGRVAVLGLDASSAGLVALLDISAPRGTTLVASWTGNGASWQDSEPLGALKGEHLVSYGPTASGGLFALLDGPRGVDRIEVATAPGMPWHQLPNPPAHIATVAFDAGGSIDALVVKDTLLSVWTLSAGSDSWTKSQAVHVRIEFGSSNP